MCLTVLHTASKVIEKYANSRFRLRVGLIVHF